MRSRVMTCPGWDGVVAGPLLPDGDACVRDGHGGADVQLDETDLGGIQGGSGKDG